MGIGNDIKPKRSLNYSRPSHYIEPKVQEKPQKIVEKAGPPKIDKALKIPDEVPIGLNTEQLDVLKDEFFNGKEQINSTSVSPEKKNNLEGFKKKFLNFSYKSVIWIIFSIIFILVIYQNYDYVKTLFGKKGTSNTTQVVKDNYYTTKNTQTNSVTNSSENSSANVATNSTTSTNNANTSTNTANTAAASNVASNTASTTPETTVDKNFSISVLNGNGVVGSADKIADTLRNSGFTVSNVTNAKNFAYQETYIYYKTGKDSSANLIKGVLSDRSVVVQQSDITAGKYDVVVVVGKN